MNYMQSNRDTSPHFMRQSGRDTSIYSVLITLVASIAIIFFLLVYLLTTSAH